jgi:hypothetical protein
MTHVYYWTQSVHKSIWWTPEALGLAEVATSITAKESEALQEITQHKNGVVVD